MPDIESRLLCLHGIERRGCDLFRMAYERDLEAIVAKWIRRTYRTDDRATSWLKIENPKYSQMRYRHEFFELRQFEGRVEPEHRHARIPCSGDGVTCLRLGQSFRSLTVPYAVSTPLVRQKLLRCRTAAGSPVLAQELDLTDRIED